MQYLLTEPTAGDGSTLNASKGDGKTK